MRRLESLAGAEKKSGGRIGELSFPPLARRIPLADSCKAGTSCMAEMSDMTRVFGEPRRGASGRVA